MLLEGVFLVILASEKGWIELLFVLKPLALASQLFRKRRRKFSRKKLVFSLQFVYNLMLQRYPSSLQKTVTKHRDFYASWRTQWNRHTRNKRFLSEKLQLHFLVLEKQIAPKLHSVVDKNPIEGQKTVARRIVVFWTESSQRGWLWVARFTRQTDVTEVCMNRSDVMHKLVTNLPKNDLQYDMWSAETWSLNVAILKSNNHRYLNSSLSLLYSGDEQKSNIYGNNLLIFNKKSKRYLGTCMCWTI